MMDKPEETDSHMSDFYLVLIFEHPKARKIFTDALELPDNRYVDGKIIAELLKIDL